jgi:hypothetical protein
VAHASQTLAAGGAANSLYDVNQSCGTSRALTGVHVAYGPNAVGKVRGRCRKIDQSGHWVAGDQVTTPWSHTNSENEASNTTYLDCPQDRVVSAIEAKVSGTTINALRVECRLLQTGGAVNTSAAVGVSQFAGAPAGSPSGWLSCGTLPARSLVGRSRSHLMQIAMLCESPQLQSAPAPSTNPTLLLSHTVTGNDVDQVLDYARTQGFDFPNQADGPSLCTRHQVHEMEVLPQPMFPLPLGTGVGRCEFKFLAHKKLNPGWRVREVEAKRLPGFEHQVTWKWGTRPQTTSADGIFSGFFSVKLEGSAPGASVVISRLVIEGPSSDWRDAFRRGGGSSPR